MRQRQHAVSVWAMRVDGAFPSAAWAWAAPLGVGVLSWPLASMAGARGASR